MAKKTNPNKIPRTEADCKHALTEGIEIGTKHALKMALYILLDKHGAPAEDVQQLSEELTWLAQKLAKSDTKEGAVVELRRSGSPREPRGGEAEMSIIVKGMEMPKTCCNCDLKFYDPELLWDENGIEQLGAWVCKRTREIIWNTQRGENCPLLSLPEGHGRLGDLDALFQVIGQDTDRWLIDDVEAAIQNVTELCASAFKLTKEDREIIRDHIIQADALKVMRLLSEMNT